jgi:hypothetical protein
VVECFEDGDKQMCSIKVEGSFLSNRKTVSFLKMFVLEGAILRLSSRLTQQYQKRNKFGSMTEHW